MNLNTATYNPGYVPIRKSPVPAVLFSNANNTTVTNVTAETGTGFGMRLTGPKPCYTFPITGSVVSNVIMVNHGTGGFAAVDIDCQNGARLTNINIHGGILALYNDENTVLNGEVYYGVNAVPACMVRDWPSQQHPHRECGDLRWRAALSITRATASPPTSSSSPRPAVPAPAADYTQNRVRPLPLLPLSLRLGGWSGRPGWRA